MLKVNLQAAPLAADPKSNTDVGKATPNLEKNKYTHIGARREEY